MDILESPSPFLVLRPAETLPEIARTVEPYPLERKAELDAFYTDGVQQLQGKTRLEKLRLALEDAIKDQRCYKAFLIGHPGVGKSTELARLAAHFASDLHPLQINLMRELNPGTLRFYDILLLLLVRIVEEVSSPTIIGFQGHNLEQLLSRVKTHLSTKWRKHLQSSGVDWSLALDLPLIAKIRGGLRQGRSTEQGTEDYEVSFVSELVDLTNDLLQACHDMLAKNNHRQWILIVEDMEKLGLSPDVIRALFIGLRPSLQALNINIIFTIPVWLHFSEDANVILPSSFANYVIPDIAVYQKDHQVDSVALAALTELVEKRVVPALFEAGAVRNCVLASGGNLRDLFILLRESMYAARSARNDKITLENVAVAVVSLRNEYKQRLGTTGSTANEVPLQDKISRLVQIYKREDPKAEVADPALYSLLRNRFVLQFNGTAWMGLHPLAVDLLIAFGELPAEALGGSGI